MATLTVNANDTTGQSVQVRYRVLNSGGTYITLNLDASQLPYAIIGVPSAQYEIGTRNVCQNGTYSAWVTSSSTACTPIVSFTVALSGSNFVVSATLASPQTQISVQMTDPNGGQSTFTSTFGSQTGSFNIPVTTGLFGNYSFVGVGVCDATAVPPWVSAGTAPVTVNYSSGPANNVSVFANYNLTITGVNNGSATGVPGALNSLSLFNNSITAYTPTLTAGTIQMSYTGTLGPATAHAILVIGGTQVDSQPVTTGGGSVVLTNPSTINAPTTISIQIVTP